ncbi:MAG: O-antigen ligase family protein [Ignavibacteria bacterium]|nr:O-antigen ligase family protein [Ignavibacteria bacterium]
MDKYNNIIFISFFLIIFFLIVYLFSIGKTLIPIVLLTVPLIFILIENAAKYYLFYLTSALFIEQYFYVPLKIQVVNVVAFGVFILFLTNKNTQIFNSFRLPNVVKYTAVFFVLSIFLSAVNTVHISFASLYFFFLFFTYITTGYLVFRSVKNEFTIEKFFTFYFYGMAVACFVIIIQTIITSRLRSKGFIGFPVMDFSAITFSFLILKYFIKGKLNLKILIISSFIFTVLIISLSRFAWIGFIFSLTYGLIISYKFDQKWRNYFKEKFKLIMVTAFILIGVLIGLGVKNVIATRFSDLTFEFFEQKDDGEYIQNSMETRALIWFTAYNAFETSPYTGIGHQMFNFVSEEYNVLPDYFFELYVEGLDPHNTMLAFLSETGLIGLSSYLIFIFTMYFLSLKSIKMSENENEKTNSILLNVAVFFMIINSIYSGQYTMTQQAFFMYIFLGLNTGNYIYLKNKLADKGLSAK